MHYVYVHNAYVKLVVIVMEICCCELWTTDIWGKVLDFYV